MAELKLKQVSSSKYLVYGEDVKGKMHPVGEFVEDFANKRWIWTTRGFGSDKFGENFVSQIACSLKQLNIELLKTIEEKKNV